MASRASLIQSRSIYVGTSNAVAPSDGNLIVTGNVGIGTTAPGAKLEVNGTVVAGTYNNTRAEITSNGRVQEFYSTEANPRWVISRDLVGGGQSGIGFNDTVGTIDVTGSAIGGSLLRALGFYTSNGTALVERMRIADGGNVGIGTTAPATKLDVNGGINIANGNNLTWGGAYAAGIPTIVGYNAGAGGALYFYPNGSTSGTKMFIASDGNVGIGTTSPGSLLSVGDSFATIPGITVDTGNTGNSAFVARKTASKPAFGILPWDANVYLSAGIYYDGNSWIQNSNGTDNLLFDLQPGTGVNWYASNDSTSSWNVASAVNLWDASGQWTSTVKSTRTGNSYFTGGNVGIGTTSPQVELHVKGNNGWGEVRVEGQTFASGHGASLEFYSEGTALADVYASTSKDLILRTNGTTERMRITSAGNVGIGTTSPNRTLTVNGIVGVTNGTANTQQLVISTDANGAYLTSSYIGSSSYVPMIFETGGSERMRITTDGSLLVGATNPDIGGSVKGTIIRQDGSIVAARNIASPFHYQSPISADRMNTMGDGIMYSMWREGLFQAGIGATNASNMTFFTGDNSSASERMRITAAGNVGIGTTAPTSKLYIEGGSADWNETTPGLSVGTIHLDPGTETNDYGNAITFGASDSGGGGNAHAGIYLRSDGTYGTKMYFATTDSYASGSKTRMFINNNGNVGIGTTSPSYRLDVAGGDARFVAAASTDALVRIIAANYATEYDARLFLGENDTNGMTIEYDGSNNVGFIGMNSSTDPTGAYSKRIRMSRDGSEVSFPVGNVGIGTTSPSEKLHIYGTSNQIIKIENSGTYLMYLGLVSNEGYIGSTNATPLTFYTNNVNRMYINTSGNIGIGTTAPTETLDLRGVLRVSRSGVNDSGIIAFGNYVNGAGYYDNGIFRSSLNAITTSGNVLHMGSYEALAFTASANPLGSQTIRMYISATSGNVGIGTTSPGAKLHVDDSSADAVIRISKGASTIGNIDLVNEGNRFSIQDDGVRRFVIDTSGNVGIGTTSPTEILNIARTGTDNYIKVEAGGQAANYSGIMLTEAGINWGWSLRHSAGTDLLYISYQNNTPTFSDLVTFTRTGNVGIGTTAPGAYLEVKGDTTFNDVVGIFTGTGQYGSSIHLNATGTSGSNWRILSTANGSTPGGGFFGLYNDSVGLYRFVISPTGNVGIGTTAPTEKLHVDGNAVLTYNNSYQGINSIGNKAILARVSPTTGIINYAEYATAANLNGFVMGSDDARVKGNIATDSLEFITNGSTRVTVLSNGDVGIGTTSPTEKLQVNGSLKLDDGNADGPQLKLASSGYSDWNIDNFSGSLRAYYGSTEYTRLTSSGNFGIGVTPSYKLDVAGDTRITSGSLGVGVVPDATDGRIDASNDIVAYSSSDRRLKENITPIANALDKVKSLTGVEFDWKPEHKKAHGYEGHDTGVIAQEVQEVMPTAVRTNDTGYLAVRYEKLIGLLIEANKELAARVEELENKLK